MVAWEETESVFKEGLTDLLVGIIGCIETGQDWDEAETPSKRHFYQLKSAHSVGIYEPFTPEQTSLSLYLDYRNAGRKLCDYAWRLYAQSLCTMRL